MCLCMHVKWTVCYCQVFLSWPHSCLPATSCCVYFFIQSVLWHHGQTGVNNLFVVLYQSSLSIVYLINYQMFYHWSLLCISIESLHAYFIWVFGHQLLLEPNIHCHATLHYECNYCKLCLYFSRELPDFLTKEVPHETFPI